MMLALSFIFGSLRSVTAGARIVTGICFGFLFYVVNEIFGQMSVVFNAPAFFRCTDAKSLVYGDYLVVTRKKTRLIDTITKKAS